MGEGRAEIIHEVWSALFFFCMWRLLKWQQERRFVTEGVNKQESNRGCFVTLSAVAQGGRWRLNELERFVLPSGCYHCYKCSGPHNHTLSPLNSPNTARHPHTYPLICVFFLPFVAMATGIRPNCVAGISVKRNYYGQWQFFSLLRLVLQYLEPPMLSYTMLTSWSARLLCATILHRGQLFRIVCSNYLLNFNRMPNCLWLKL